jgi:hypothetical protein
MAIEIALIAVGILVFVLIWQLRTSRQLSGIEGEVNALRDMVSRVFLMQLNCKTESEPSRLGAALRPPTSDVTTKNETRDYDALQLELELETAAIGDLCAKLITLVPPQEAAPLLAPDRAPSGVRERRRSVRHQTPRVGKIILHQGSRGDVCTVGNMSPAGALLLVANARDLPEQFDLHMDGYGRRCIATQPASYRRASWARPRAVAMAVVQEIMMVGVRNMSALGGTGRPHNDVHGR